MQQPGAGLREALWSGAVARTGTLAALLAALIALLVLTGWALDLETLKRVLPGVTAMNPMTAASFLCAAAALLLLRLPPEDGRTWAIRILPLLPIVIGASKLLDLGLGTGFALDRLLFPDRLGLGSPTPNQMAPTTAMCLFLLGVSIELASARGRYTLALHLLQVPIQFLAVLAVMGYLYATEGFYTIRTYNPMALHTALGLLLCSTALLLLQPRYGIIGLVTGEGEASRTARTLLPACLVIPIFLGWCSVTGLRLDYYGLGTALSVLVLLIVLVLFSIMLAVCWRMRLEERRRVAADRELARKADELAAANARLQEASAAKSSFLSSMSHEIRTPMNAIIGMGTLLLDSPLNEEQRDYAETIRASGDHLLTIINEILDFSKIEAQRLQLEKNRFDLRGCVEDAVDLVAATAAKKGLELAYYVDPQAEGHYLGDVGRIRQVLLNLLSNGIKFTERGEVVLQVEARAAAGGEPDLYELHFSVRDTGIGIPADRIGHLFQAFTQVDASTTRKYGGTGLGLAISQRLSELMGGRTWVESTPGAGSTFHFSIRAPRIARDLAPAGSQAVVLAGRRLLAVDDNLTNLRIIQAYAALWGIETTCVSQPAEALERLRAGERYDVALLDFHLPDTDGVRLAGEIRRLPAGATLPLVLLSSATPGRADLQAGDARFASVINKPVKAAVLEQAIAQALAPGQASVTERRQPVLSDALGAANPLRILLAEDNLVNQKVADKLLRKLGYTCDFAASGAEAIAALQRQTYDVVLMDVQMPEMDGLEATRRILVRWPHGRRPRIIGMTANATDGDRRDCMDAGMDDYLAKPVTVPQLISALQRCTRRAA